MFKVKSRFKALRQRMRRARHALRWELDDALDRVRYPARAERGAARGRTAHDAPAQPIRRVYADVSVIAQHDAGSGIQRVVREVRNRLPGLVRPDVQVIPLVVRHHRRGYETMDGTTIVSGPDALFLGLDFATDSVVRHRDQLRAFQAAGGRLWFLVHDLLPMTHPAWFTAASRVKYRRWMRQLAMLADGLLCVSPPVARLLRETMLARYGLASPPPIHVIPLGSDVGRGDRVEDPAALPLADGLTPSMFRDAAIVVGTLEPRKGHRDVLDAFELLWRDGFNHPLIFIGRPGWNVKALERRIRDHAEHGRRLFWLDDVDDRGLFASYAQARLAIVPSLAEGYGLPLDEALALGATVLARDIEVFRRHPDAALTYFPADADAATIAAAVRSAFAADASTSEVTLPGWDETTRSVAEAIGCA